MYLKINTFEFKTKSRNSTYCKYSTYIKLRSEIFKLIVDISLDRGGTRALLRIVIV